MVLLYNKINKMDLIESVTAVVFYLKVLELTITLTHHNKKKAV